MKIIDLTIFLKVYLFSIKIMRGTTNIEISLHNRQASKYVKCTYVYPIDPFIAFNFIFYLLYFL